MTLANLVGRNWNSHSRVDKTFFTEWHWIRLSSLHNMYTLPYIFFVKRFQRFLQLHSILYTTTATIWNNFHTRSIKNKNSSTDIMTQTTSKKLRHLLKAKSESAKFILFRSLLLFSELCCGHAPPPLCWGLKRALPGVMLFWSMYILNQHKIWQLLLDSYFLDKSFQMYFAGKLDGFEKNWSIM